MEVVVAKNIGPCFGVTRAINEALKEMSENTYFLGELVHNKIIIDKLNGKVVNNIDEIPDKSKVIIRIHGVTKDIIKKAKEKKLEIIDLTCPKVLKIHELVNERKNNLIIIIGIKDHPEVIGTIGYANEYIIIENENDLKTLEEKLKTNSKKISIFAETTFSNLDFVSLVNKIKRMVKTHIEIIPSICPVIIERQKEVNNMLANCDKLILVGDKNSSNTRNIYELAPDKIIWVESKENLDLKEIKKYNKIGIISGTSTASETINEIISRLGD